MAKNKATKSEKSREKEDSSKDLSIIEPDPPIDRIINIQLNAIENILTKDPVTVVLSVQHNGVNLGESPPLAIQPDCSESPIHDIGNFTVQLPVTVNYPSSINPIVSVPVLITLMHSPSQSEHNVSARESVTKKKTKFTLKSATGAPTEIGVCSLDLMPILLGDPTFTEKLIIHTPQFTFDGSAVSWRNLPLLTVTVTQDEEEMFPSPMQPCFLSITVESIYNPPQSFNDNSEYTVGTVIHVNDQTVENVMFEGGKLTKYRDVEQMKRWQPLWKMKGRAQLSKYRIDGDTDCVKNEFKKEFDLAKMLQENMPRIEWNSMHRYMLLRGGTSSLEQLITKFRFWPFELVVAHESEEAGKGKSEDRKSHMYQFYVDLAELLFPGRTKTRVIAQLHTYNLTELMEKTGLQQSAFDSKEDKKESNDTEKKGKNTAKSTQHHQNTTVQTQSVISEAETIAPSVPVRTETDEPVLIVVQFELNNPLIPSRIAEDFDALLAQLSIPKDRPSYPYSSKVAEDHFVLCVQKLVDVLTESYRDFCDERAKRKSDLKIGECELIHDEKTQRPAYYCEEPDELSAFSQFLLRTGVYQTVRATLKSKIVFFLDQKYKIELSTLSSIETQNFIASVFTCLAEQMNLAINTVVEGRPKTRSLKIVNPEKLYLYAEEAQELGDVESAKKYHLKAIAQNKTDALPWIKYAIGLLKANDIERAIECLREAITLNTRYKITLLMYGVLLAQKECYREAGIFLRALVNLYPRFAEGWCILHIFYIRTEYYPGKDLTICVAEKCMKDKDRGIWDLDTEPLAWSMIHCPKENIYAVTATLLLKLQLCDFACIALAEELSVTGRSTHVLYYMAVEHYLSQRPEDAISHLKEARYSYGMDYSLSSLMGHCYIQLGNFEEAMNCYEFADMVFDRPNDLHLVHLRMGLYYEDTERYERAKKAFLSACKTSPTSRSWLGAGIVFYHLKQFNDAELALSEANQIDNQNADVWGYLCLLNMALGRYNEFLQCYREMTKNNLRNAKLWLMITDSMEALGYTPPISSISDTCVNVEDSNEVKKEKSELEKKSHCKGDGCAL